MACLLTSRGHNCTQRHPQCRVVDLPEAERSSTRFTKLLMVIEGPDEPSRMDGILQALLQDLLDAGPTGACT